MSLFAEVEHAPYKTSVECQNTLAGIEAIDYFFARQIINYQQSEKTLECKPEEYLEIFHVLIALSFFQRQGSVCISLSNIANSIYWNDVSKERNFDVNIQFKGYRFSALETLVSRVERFVKGLPSNTFLALEDDRLYSKRYWQYEQNFCYFIATKLSSSSLMQWESDLSHKHSEISRMMKLMFSSLIVKNKVPDFQQLSVLNALLSPFSIITGGAGTGKTYTITRLAVLLSHIRHIPANLIEMAAPTGKAANRLAQSLGDELLTLSAIPELKSICTQLRSIVPKTISRLLKVNPTNGQSAYNAQRTLAASLVIVDETSMIDISLMNKLINSLSENTQLILVGDPNQLPSVETGSLLADLVAHPIGGMTQQRWTLLQTLYPALNDGNEYAKENLVHPEEYATSAVNCLSQMRRSSQEIASFAQAVLNANVQEALLLAKSNKTAKAIRIKPFYTDDLNEGLSFKTELLATIKKEILPHFTALFSATTVEQAFCAIKSYALLTPFRKSIVGTHSLNDLIEQQLSLQYEWVKPNKIYRCKPIMILQNDYQLSLFNGDIGLIWESDDKQKFAYFETANGLVKYPIYNLPSFEVNYAMTIHKTQGSEFESVDIILPNIENEFLNRQLLYTGITRAKLNVSLYTDTKTLTQVIMRTADRISGIDINLSKAIKSVN